MGGLGHIFLPPLVHLGYLSLSTLALRPCGFFLFSLSDPFETPVYVVGLTNEPLLRRTSSRCTETFLEMKWLGGFLFVGFGLDCTRGFFSL